MARDFNGTSGYLTSTLVSAQQSLDTVSYSFWEYPDTVPQYRCTFSRPENSSYGARCEFDDGWGWVFIPTWTTTEGTWSLAKPSTGAWTHSVITYNYGATTNDPIWYRDGTSTGLIERRTPAGTKVNNGTAFNIGRNAFAAGQYFDGRICEFGIWNRILSSGEAISLSKGLSPLFFPRGLVFYVPIIGRTSPEVELMNGATGALTGTANQIAHPRIIYPQGAF